MCIMQRYSINHCHIIPPQPLSPKAEAEMRRARATSRIDEEEDLQYFMEEIADRSFEGEKEGNDDDKKGRLGTSVGGCMSNLSHTPASSSDHVETRDIDNESKVLLTPPAKVSFLSCLGSKLLPNVMAAVNSHYS